MEFRPWARFGHRSCTGENRPSGVSAWIVPSTVRVRRARGPTSRARAAQPHLVDVLPRCSNLVEAGSHSLHSLRAGRFSWRRAACLHASEAALVRLTPHKPELRAGATPFCNASTVPADAPRLALTQTGPPSSTRSRLPRPDPAQTRAACRVTDERRYPRRTLRARAFPRQTPALAPHHAGSGYHSIPPRLRVACGKTAQNPHWQRIRSARPPGSHPHRAVRDRVPLT